MLRRIFHATMIMLVMMTGAAYAQMPTPGLHVKDSSPSRSKEQKQYDKALDRAYQSTIKKIPDAEKRSTDPWGNIRPSPSVAAKNKQQ
jgi:uncharacterized protein YecT (DUF1311 family)